MARTSRVNAIAFIPGMTSEIASRPLRNDGVDCLTASQDEECPLQRWSPSNLDLGPELHHLLGRHAEERGGAFGVALQEGEDVFAP
jgi:hypothetical protein